MLTGSVNTVWLYVSGGIAFVVALAFGWSVAYKAREYLPVPVRLLRGLSWYLPVALFGYAVVSLSVNVPVWDDYDALLSYLALPGNARVSHVFDFHNEHRIAIVRGVAELVMLAGGGVFDFRGMICVGNLIALAYAFLLVRKLPPAWGAAFLWAFLSLLTYENMLWALTAVQSNAVLFFAWVSLFCLERAQWISCGTGVSLKAGLLFSGVLVSAVFCTLTSGSGLFIWPCLGLFLVGHWWQEKTDRVARATFPIWRLACVVLVGAIVWGLYLRGMPPSGNAEGEPVWRHPFTALAYGIVFCGGIAHFLPLACLAGVCVVAAVVYVLPKFRQCRDQTTLCFLLFLLCAAGSATLFRSSFGIEQALSFRYRVIAVSIAWCCCVLLNERWSGQWDSLIRWGSAGFTFCCVFLNLAAYFIGYPLLAERRDNLMAGIRKWPEISADLSYPSNRLDHADGILKECAVRGIWRLSGHEEVDGKKEIRREIESGLRE